MRLYNFGKHIGLTKLTDREFQNLSSYNTAIFGRLEGLRLLIFIHGQQINVHIVCVQKAIKIITEISTAHRSGQLKKVEHWLELLPLQLSKIEQLNKKQLSYWATFWVCQVHLFNKKRDTINVKGLIDLNGAWVREICRSNCEPPSTQAAAFAVNLSAVHTMRDPFPFEHCKLLLFKRDAWTRLFKHGEDTLTRQDLDDNRADLDLDKIVCFTIDGNDQQAHVSMHRTAPAGASVLTRVREYAELEVIYYKIKAERRK
ncbi:21532_t:CDS:2 [Gigaspora margarita]|uniref:21532_t:CDS:1 n=1 Tax=Gigaspora margarita TaxID=4874 RepID=A0ABN7UU22_GIGMA|nr:21532_t:CDS:2 [Gigaspora margarita]